MESLKKLGPIALIALILLITGFTFFKIPNNLKEAMKKMEVATSKIDESVVLLKEQKIYLDSVIAVNKVLQEELVLIIAENDSLSITMKERFDNAHSYLYSILKRVKELPDKIEDPG